MEKTAAFLKEAGTYYLATTDGDQPRVRPFGTVNIFDGKLYIQTGKSKDVSKQLHANPKAEICAFKDGNWLRVACELIGTTEGKQESPCLTLILSFVLCTARTTATLRCST